MSTYVLTVNGKRHVCTVDKNGKETFEPKLDASFERESSRRFREMLATQTAPRVMTDDVFFGGFGRRTLLDQFDGDEYGVNELVAAARKRGYEPSPHDVYVDTIADGWGDPEAFISGTGGRSQIRKVCEKRGLGCSGVVNVEPVKTQRDFIKDPVHKLAPDIVEEELTKARQNPENQSIKDSELREQIIDKHSLKI